MAATYTAGPVSLLPFDRSDPPEHWDEFTKESVLAILDDFIGIDGNPISNCSLVSIGGKLLLEDYPEAGKIETLSDYVELACVVCLSGRELLTTAEPYCNSDCFSAYQRQYRRGWGTSAPPIRRRDDIPMGLSGLALQVHAPKHTVPIMKLSFEGEFFKALSELRRMLIDSGRLEQWARWQESIFCFNQANTDSEAIPPHIEWVLMASAIQRVHLAPREIEEPPQIRDAETGPHHEQLGRGGDEGDRLEALEGVGIDVRIEARVDGDRVRHHQQRVAVGRRAGDERGTRRGAGAGPVLDHHRRGPLRLEAVGQDARHRVDRAARRGRNHQFDGA